MELSDKKYKQLLSQRLHDVFSLEPNDLGPRKATIAYKMFTSHLKTHPLLPLVPLSAIAALTMYLLFGPLVVKLVSLLQYGF